MKLKTLALLSLSVATFGGTVSADTLKPGIEVENSGSVLMPRTAKLPMLQDRYWWMQAPIINDFTGDGLDDVLWVGVMPAQKNAHSTSEGVHDICGDNGIEGWQKTQCNSENSHPIIFAGTKSGEFKQADILNDNRKTPGMQNPIQVLVNDYNNDGMLDIYIADTGLGDTKLEGIRDSYFLSQPDGTLLESSSSHLDKKALGGVFNHGAASGDIDGDGAADIVYTNLKNDGLMCLMNNGKGVMKTKSCGTIRAFGIELADVDGDGDLDMIHGAHEYGKHRGRNWKTGIAFNNGKGKFKFGSVSFKENKLYPTVMETSAWDIDNDGDLDIVLSRAGVYYAGTAIEVLENVGNNKFNSSLYELVKKPVGFKTKTEGNEWNSYIQSVRFADADSDGDIDILLFNNGNPKVMPGSILRNDGDLNMTCVRGVRNTDIVVVDQDLFIE